MKKPFLRNTLAAAITATVAGLGGGHAMAGNVITEGDEDIIISTKGGFEAKTASEDFSFKIGGRIQVQYDSFDDTMNLIEHDGSTANNLFFRRARVYLKGTFYEDWAYKIQFNLVDSGSGGGTVEDLYIRWQKFNWFNMTFGKHKEPLSLQELTSSKWVTTVERSAIDDFLAEGRSLGASLHGANNFWGYALGIYDTESSNDEGVEQYAVTGRAFLSPINSERALLHIGLGGTTRKLNDSGDEYDGGTVTQGIKKGDEVSIFIDDADAFTIFNIEAAGKIGPVHAQAEYHQRDTSAIDDGEDATTSGYYVQAGWFITGESRAYKKGIWKKVKPNNRGIGAWEIFARWEALDFSDKAISADTQNKGTIATIGANWYPNDIIRVSANYVLADWDNALASNGDDLVRADSLIVPTGPVKDSGSGFAVRFQAAF